MITSKPNLQRGVSLIETMVTVAVIGIMLGVGLPSLAVWMKSNQIKSSSQNILTGLQLARGEAVRQNSRVLFQLTDSGATGVPTWTVWSYSSQPCQTVANAFPCPIESSQSSEGGNTARIGVNADDISGAGYSYTTAIAAGTGMGVSPRPGVVFNAFGQVLNDGAANAIATRITRIDITDARETRARRMVVRIPAGGSATMCDPAAKNSQGC
ncbi:MAG: GspH/FimT family pseudopilin [Gallionella sp.]|nr:GspH/FimT family pseudopilin [Gallionella sp.]